MAADPTNANAAYEAGELNRKSGQYAKARELFETALQHYPKFEDAQIGLGRVLISLKKPALAVPHLEKAIALNPEAEVAYYSLATAQRELGNEAAQQKALAEFRRVRSEKASRQENALFIPREVTKQELDSKDQ